MKARAALAAAVVAGGTLCGMGGAHAVTPAGGGALPAEWSLTLDPMSLDCEPGATMWSAGASFNLHLADPAGFSMWEWREITETSPNRTGGPWTQVGYNDARTLNQSGPIDYSAHGGIGGAGGDVKTIRIRFEAWARLNGQTNSARLPVVTKYRCYVG